MGQWKVDLNRERVDSSGRQQFVERSIVNRIFTMDRQVGVQLRGRLFEGTMADMRYYAGVFNGEGRGVKNNSTDHLYMGRLQWNFLGRDLPWK
jgi:phosphate-selective porin